MSNCAQPRPAQRSPVFRASACVVSLCQIPSGMSNMWFGGLKSAGSSDEEVVEEGAAQ